jgi:hypothetical protein
VRHEDVDEHDVERRLLDRAHPCVGTVGDGDVETVTLKTDLNGPAYHWVVIDHENTRHDELSPYRNGRIATASNQP